MGTSGASYLSRGETWARCRSWQVSDPDVAHPAEPHARQNMALVHLITANPDRSRKLESDLRSRGFEVLIVAPGDEPASAPDFQIVVEEHSPELVLHAAAQMA